jgi:hypothetical protein
MEELLFVNEDEYRNSEFVFVIWFGLKLDDGFEIEMMMKVL